MQQEQDTKGKRFFFPLKNIKPHRITMFQQIILARSGISSDRNGPDRNGGGGGLCLVNMHCPPPPPLKSLEARFQAFVLRK